MLKRFSFEQLKDGAFSIGTAIGALYIGSLAYTHIGRPAVVQGEIKCFVKFPPYPLSQTGK